MQAAMGAARAGGPDVGIAVPYAAGGLAEVSLTPAAIPEVAARSVALARRLGWKLVFTGPGGPIERGLRQALAGALQGLAAERVSDEVVAAALDAYGLSNAATSFLPAAPPEGEAVVAACVTALVAEGARMLQDGRARRPLEIDAVALMSGLLPRWEGGPMFQADRRGLLVVRQDLIERAERSALYLPCELIDALIADGRTFASLNAR